MRVLQSSTEAEALVRAAQRAPTVAQRIVWLHKAATAWGRPLQAVAACAKGCSHCCHIPLTISGKEAQMISRATGLAAMKSPRNAVPVQDLVDDDSVTSASARLHHWQTGMACPFLTDDACSIYEVRPLACRVLFNLDDDDLLCRHGATQPADVPYADSRMLRALALAAQPAETLADIRDFFPVPSTS
jgi:Fe-S-cluster containining protein